MRARLPAHNVFGSQAIGLIDAMRDRPIVAKGARQGLDAAWAHALDAGRLPEETPNWQPLGLSGKLPGRGKNVKRKARGPAKYVLSPFVVSAPLRCLPGVSRDVEAALVLHPWTAGAANAGSTPAARQRSVRCRWSGTTGSAA